MNVDAESFPEVTNIEKHSEVKYRFRATLHRLTFLKVLSLSSFSFSTLQNLFCSYGRENISTESVSECSGLSKLKSVLINAFDYSSGKRQNSKQLTQT